MDQELITLTQRIVKDTMEKLAEKQKLFNTYKRRPRIPSTNSKKNRDSIRRSTTSIRR